MNYKVALPRYRGGRTKAFQRPHKPHRQRLPEKMTHNYDHIYEFQLMH